MKLLFILVFAFIGTTLVKCAQEKKISPSERKNTEDLYTLSLNHLIEHPGVPALVIDEASNNHLLKLDQARSLFLIYGRNTMVTTVDQHSYSYSKRKRVGGIYTRMRELVFFKEKIFTKK